MRGFEVKIFKKDEKGILKINSNQNCYAGIKQYISDLNKGKEVYIYIKDFRDKLTEKYIPLLTKTISKITFCKLVKRDGTEYIKFKLLKNYDSSLILLSFVRNLWYSPGAYYGNTDKNVYSQEFFKELAISEYTDPFEMLTSANKVACQKAKLTSLGHSNCHPHASLKIIKKEKFLKSNLNSTAEILITL